MLNFAQVDRANETGPANRPARRGRYAIYYTPQRRSAFASFGRSWFGRANDGATLQAFCSTGVAGPADSKLSPFPDRYIGLHAPFVSPFALREDTDLDEL